MKKVLAIFGIVCSIFLLAFGVPEKKLKVEMTIQEWNLIYDCLDKSTASHAQVKQAFELLNKQILPQVDTTKKK